MHLSNVQVCGVLGHLHWHRQQPKLWTLCAVQRHAGGLARHLAHVRSLGFRFLGSYLAHVRSWEISICVRPVHCVL